MKSADKIHNLFKQSNVTVHRDVDKRILEQSLAALGEASPGAGRNIWRNIMHSKITKIAAAAALLIAVYWLTVSEKTLPQAYAIDQTLEAMKSISSVHFKAELYKQGDVECWMLFDESHTKPTHVCLYMPGFPIRKIDTPKGLFAYNATTNRYRVNLRDERQADWYPDFANFFKQSLEEAKANDKVTITEAYNDELQRQVIVVNVDEGDRKCQYVIDPQSKLPIRFTTTKTTDLKKWMRKTIAVKNISFIEYNLPEPEDLFKIPADAQKVTEEIDVMVRPGVGMKVGQLSPEQACQKLVEEFVDAVAQFDFEKAKNLYFPFMVPPPEKIVMMKLAKAAAGGVPLIEILEIGQPAQEGLYWIVPCKVREMGGHIKNDPVRVRFFELDGVEYCIIAMPD